MRPSNNEYRNVQASDSYRRAPAHRYESSLGGWSAAPSAKPATATGSTLPPNVERFVERYLASAAELEVLLLVRQRSAERWDAGAVAKELRIDADQAQLVLRRLERNRLLRRADGGFCYDPATPALAGAVADLADLYPAFRVAVISLIFSRPAGPIRDFSEAFRLRPEAE